METLKRAEQLKAELDSLRPLDSEAEARIMQKFRLDWNYHSNNLEGNTLTYGETKALILFGITAQGKPLKDHFEITGHNEAINWVLNLVKGETELSEVFIRELHTLLLKEASYKEATTSDGKPTRRKIEVGKYKTQPNHVLTVTGETFYFANPEETPAKMQELVDWFRKEKGKPDVNPIILAALFHYRFIRIHPFDDGNGRVARILMNFILMQFGYPPAIIKTEDKENYYAVLRLADADELEPFIEYITQNLIRSLEIMIRGAKGGDIEEPDDLEKELALLDTRLGSIGEKANVKLDSSSYATFLSFSGLPIVGEFINSCKRFERFYASLKFTVAKNPNFFAGSSTGFVKQEMNSRTALSDAQLFLNELTKEFYLPDGQPSIIEISIAADFESFSRILDEELSYKSILVFLFNERSFSVLDDRGQTLLQKGFTVKATKKEITNIIRHFSTLHKEFIENDIVPRAENKKTSG